MFDEQQDKDEQHAELDAHPAPVLELKSTGL